MAPLGQVVWALVAAIINSTHSIYLIEFPLGFQMVLASSRFISWRSSKPFKPFRFVPDLIIQFQNTGCNFLYWHLLSLFPSWKWLRQSKEYLMVFIHGLFLKCIYFLHVLEIVVLIEWFPKHSTWGCWFPGLWHLLTDAINDSGEAVAKVSIHLHLYVLTWSCDYSAFSLSFLENCSRVLVWVG